MMGIEEYLDILTGQIRCKKARGAVREEIRCHIEDQAEAYRKEGLCPEKAQERALREMGDPVAAGEELDRIHRPRMIWKEAGVIGVLGIAGLLIQYFLELRLPEQAYLPAGPMRQLVLLTVSFALMAGVCCLDYSRIGHHAKAISLALFAFLLVGKQLFGASVNGGERWIYLYGISINIPMLVFLFVPLYGAILYSLRGGGIDALGKSLLWMLPGLFLAFACSSIYTAAVLWLACLATLSVSVWKNWFRISQRLTLGGLWGGAVLIPALAGWLACRYSMGYRAARIQAVFDSTGGYSYQRNIIRGLIEGSKWIGQGTGQADGEAVRITDYVLTYAISYYGILAGLMIVGVLALLFLHFFRISLRQRNQLGMIMGVGCVGILIAEFVLYLIDALGGISIGAYCPFITYGGTGMVVTFTLFGIMLSIYRYEPVLPGIVSEKAR